MRIPSSVRAATAVMVVAWTSGCSQPTGPSSKSAAVPPPATSRLDIASVPLVPGQLYLNQAQPKLHTIKIYLGSQTLDTELARSTVEIATGMMYRDQMGENEGMLFLFPFPRQVSFYMRNTKVPLSAAYIDPQGTILEIHDMNPFDETAISASTSQVQYVLEVPQGWFQRHQVSVGTVLRTDQGTLKDSFYPRTK